jgi:hypothetical protein
MLMLKSFFHDYYTKSGINDHQTNVVFDLHRRLIFLRDVLDNERIRPWKVKNAREILVTAWVIPVSAERPRIPILN